MSIKFLVLGGGGGYFGFWGRGGSADFIFMGARIFLKIFGVPKMSEFTKPPGSYEFCGFAYR